MDYLSHLRGLKSAIASILYRHLKLKRSEMKYSKLGGLESAENLDVLIVDMMESEILNCNLDSDCETSIDNVRGSGEISTENCDVNRGCQISTEMKLGRECVNTSTDSESDFNRLQENDLNSECETENDIHESVLSEISNDSCVMDTSMNKILCTVYHEDSVAETVAETESECDKDTNNDNNSVTVQCTSTKNNSNSDKILFNYESDAPLRLVVNYHFHFDLNSDNTESEIQQTQSECIEQEDANDSFFNVTGIKQAKSECIRHDNADDSLCNVTALSETSNDLDFDDYVSGSDSFFAEDGFLVTNQSEIHGSKNNLLDASVDPEHHAAYINKGLVDYDSEEEEECDADEEKGKQTVPVRTVKPFTPSMKKGFIYYSSAAQLYTGQLCYEDVLAEKKQGLVRKLFKKVFPSQKYVIN